MPYTYKSFAFAWLIIFALLAVSASGVTRGWWLGLLIAVAITVPALVLRSRSDVATASPGRPLIVPDRREHSRFDRDGIDVLRWENEGGARRRLSRDGVRAPA